MITLLDGGLGQELVARSGDAPTPLWSTQVMIDHPGLTQGLHADYFAAGASLATTNTYALHHDRLIRAGIDEHFDGLFAQALNEACGACAAHGRGAVAGSLGPRLLPPLALSVDASPFTRHSLPLLRQNPPAAILIDLSRLPA
ncbi:MAG: homocysteine S-methyltransferase family protein, partial [Gemmobacter sp.]